MDVESRLDRALRRGGETVEPDLSAALLDVHRQARRRATKRRVVLASAVGVVLVAGVVAKLGAPGLNRTQEPVAPPRETAASDTVSLAPMREASAASLGMRKLLSAAVAPNGHVYVTDTSQRVVELTPDLDVVRSWGGSGAGPGRFRLVQGSIAVGSDGNVYVADTGNFRIQVFTANGTFVRSVGEFGSGPGQFTWPFDLVVDADGNVYVADDKEETLAKLSPSGDQLWRRGGLRESDPRLQGHSHISSFDADGRLLVTIDDNGQVLLLDSDGVVVETLDATMSDPGRVCDATTDAAGVYYLTPCLEPWDVLAFRPDGTAVGSWEGAGLVQAPRWTADGRGYAVTVDGGIVEVAAAVD
jgi:outer membrane protein assembly factor BamB